MGVTVVRYTTKPERADENQALTEAVFAELAENRPAGLHYESYRLADGVSFVHVASVDTNDGSNPLTATPAFAAFVQAIGERCSVPPLAMDATMIGRYSAATPVTRP
jgi:hypothetical protein